MCTDQLVSFASRVAQNPLGGNTDTYLHTGALLAVLRLVHSCLERARNYKASEQRIAQWLGPLVIGDTSPFMSQAGHQVAVSNKVCGPCSLLFLQP